MKTAKRAVHIIVRELFQFSIIIYLILFLAELMKEGFVSYFFNPSILLIVIIISGISMIITQSENEVIADPEKPFSMEMQNSVVYAIAGGAIVYVKTKDMGGVSLFLTAMTVLLILLLSFLLFSDDKK